MLASKFSRHSPLYLVRECTTALSTFVSAAVVLLSSLVAFGCTARAQEEPHFRQKLVASTLNEEDSFGASISASPDMILIGAPVSDGAREYMGAAYVFTQTADGKWTETDRLTYAQTSGGLGASVELSGKHAFAGVPGDSRGEYMTFDDGPRRFTQGGRVTVFEQQTDSTWELTKLSIQSAPKLRSHFTGEGFGRSMDLDGTRLLVGAPFADVGANYIGAAYVFERDEAGQWPEQARLVPSDSTLAGDSNIRFGSAVALSGDRAVIGAYAHTGARGITGAVYIFERDADGTWEQDTVITAPLSLSEFGYDIALSDDRILIGAPLSQRGSAYIFEPDKDGNWREVAWLDPGADAYEYNFVAGRFGHNVALADDIALVGAPTRKSAGSTGGEKSGVAFLFKRQDDGRWLEVAELASPDGKTGDRFGAFVTISERNLFISATGANEGAGAVYHYEF